MQEGMQDVFFVREQLTAAPLEEGPALSHCRNGGDSRLDKIRIQAKCLIECRSTANGPKGPTFRRSQASGSEQK